MNPAAVQILDNLLDNVERFGGTFALSKDPNSDEWTASLHWFPTEVKLPQESKSAAGSGTSIDGALESLVLDIVG